MNHNEQRLKELIPEIQEGMFMSDALGIVADKIEIMIEALEFYGNNNVSVSVYCGGDSITGDEYREIDDGKKARETLKAIRGNNE